MLYPKTIDPTDADIAKLTQIYKTTYKTIVKEISTATDWGVANRKQILAQVDRELEKLGVDVNDFLAKELPKYYKEGASDAIYQLENIDAGIDVSTGFNKLHNQAIQALVSETSTAFGETLSGVSRSANKLLGKITRDMITQKMAEGMVGGKALRDTRLAIKGILQEDGLTALIDKGGREWSLDRYAEMLYRTKTVETRNRGIANRLVENNYDLVQVSNHGASACEACQEWQGKILSLTGDTKGYPTIAEAEADGLFHPNCRHAINVLVPSLASRTKAYDPDSKTEIIDQP